MKNNFYKLCKAITEPYISLLKMYGILEKLLFTALHSTICKNELKCVFNVYVKFVTYTITMV